MRLRSMTGNEGKLSDYSTPTRHVSTMEQMSARHEVRGQVDLRRDVTPVLEDTFHIENEETPNFSYKKHFSVKERTEICCHELWDVWKYRMRLLRRKCLPSWRTFLASLQTIVLLFMLAKYSQDSYIEYGRHDRIQNIVEQVSRIADQQQIFKNELEDFRKSNNVKRETFEDIDDKLSSLSQNVSQLQENLNTLSTESRTYVVTLGKELDNLGQTIESLKTAKDEQKKENIEAKGPQEVVIHHKPSKPNVANSLIGARINEAASSRAVSATDNYLMQAMNYVWSTAKGGYAILEREIIQPGDAWCTTDTQPSLTIQLARRTVPLSFSYQHFTWISIAPHNAPKIYDVVGCLDKCCSEVVPLANNCKYGIDHDGQTEREQFCYPQGVLPAVDSVQFRFRHNHGEVKKTCVYLVRVYGDVVEGEFDHEQVPNKPSNSSFFSIISSWQNKFFS